MHPLIFLYGLVMLFVSCFFYSFLSCILEIPIIIALICTLTLILLAESLVSRIAFKDWKFWKI